jgi:acyl carrier protein
MSSRPVSELQQAFSTALGIPADTDFANLTYRSIAEWDSVAHMQLVGELEATFDVMLATEEVLDLSSFAKAREILEKHGVSWAA